MLFTFLCVALSDLNFLQMQEQRKSRNIANIVEEITNVHVPYFESMGFQLQEKSIKKLINEARKSMETTKKCTSYLCFSLFLNHDSLKTKKGTDRKITPLYNLIHLIKIDH